MKIIVSPDSFKGSCSAIEVADSIEKAIHDVDSTIDVIKMPVADGGEGTIEMAETSGLPMVPPEERKPLLDIHHHFFC